MRDILMVMMALKHKDAIAAAKADPNFDMSDIHQHKCGCGCVWEHDLNEIEEAGAHNCPKCGTVVTARHYDADNPHPDNEDSKRRVIAGMIRFGLG